VYRDIHRPNPIAYWLSKPRNLATLGFIGLALYLGGSAIYTMATAPF
jgi:hypothetical protein